MSDTTGRITEYQAAVKAMRDGRFDLSITADHGDEIGRLGHDLHELARELDRKFSEVSKIQKISEEITAGLFMDDVMNRVYDSFRSVIPYNRMGCALLSDENRLLTACWERSDVPEMRLKAGFAAPMAGSSLQPILVTGLPRILNDLEIHLAGHPISAATRLLVDEGMRSNLTCPLIARGKPIGFLFFTSMEKHTYQHIHQNTFLQITGQVSVLIEKSQLYQQLLELNQRLLLAQRALEYQAKHDALTAIYNRGAIIELLEGQLARAGRRNQPTCIALLDVDHFKRINDTHGHPAGDGVLVTITSRIKKCLREYDFVGRYGGEEFLVVFGDAAYEAALTVAERIRLAVSDEAIRVGGEALAVTVSIGVAAVGNASGLSVDQLIAAADQALYRAKSGGRNRVEATRL